MRVKKKIVLSGFVCLLLVGLASATVFVRQTSAAYCGVCDSLDGVPGVLQRAGFIPRGDCRADTKKHEPCVHHECMTQHKKGHCKLQKRIDPDEHKGDHDHDDFVCWCVIDKISH